MQKAYSFSAKRNKILKKSSSGGVFYLIAKYYLKMLNGVVYGATIKGRNVFHTRITSINEIVNLLKSKYVKSDLKNVFSECKKDLELDRNVLFVGLPCQIYALVTYLSISKVSTKKLFTIDLICHGVPNKTTFDEYLNKQFPSEIVEKIDFRYKRPFWEDYSILIVTNKQKFIQHKFSNEYMLSFLKGYNLDKACYQCRFKGDNRRSVITIGDCWNIKSLYPKFYNNRGTSLIIVHDEKNFNKIFKYLNSKGYLNEVDFDKVIKSNPSYFIKTEKLDEKPEIKQIETKMNIKKSLKYLAKLFLKRI